MGTCDKYFHGELRKLPIILVEKSAYHNNLKYWDRQACANSVDPDQMPQNAASEQGLHCLPLIQQYFRHINM